LLEKLPDHLFLKEGGVLDQEKRVEEQWRRDQKDIVSDIAKQRGDRQPVSIVTRNKASEANVSDGERSDFSFRRTHFAKLDPRPTKNDKGTLLDGEEQESRFTFLGTEQRGGNEGTILKGEFECDKQEIDEGREKALEEIKFIRESSKLSNTEHADNVQKALAECNKVLTQQQKTAYEKLQGFYKGIFQLTYQLDKFRGTT
jgi:hypothetical protein